MVVVTALLTVVPDRRAVASLLTFSVLPRASRRRLAAFNRTRTTGRPAFAREVLRPSVRPLLTLRTRTVALTRQLNCPSLIATTPRRFARSGAPRFQVTVHELDP